MNDFFFFQGGLSYEEMKDKLSASGSVSQITVVCKMCVQSSVLVVTVVFGQTRNPKHRSIRH